MKLSWSVIHSEGLYWSPVGSMKNGKALGERVHHTAEVSHEPRLDISNEQVMLDKHSGYWHGLSKVGTWRSGWG